MGESERGSGKTIDPERAITWPVGVGLGAALGYLLDPENGRRRRRLIHDKAIHFKRVGTTEARKAIADAENRLRGAVAEVRARADQGTQHVPDDLLVDRVRARLGHVASHSRVLEVYAQGGQVTLSGPALESEADNIVREVGAVPGVQAVHDELERFESAEDVPSLQGGRERKGRRFFGTEWMPAYRMFGLAASLPLIGYGLRQRGASGGVVTGLGATLLVRSLTNMPLSKLLGVDAGPDVIRVRKHFRVDASPEHVVSHLRDPANVRELFSLLESVTRVSPGNEEGTGSIWELLAAGPLGLPVRWQVELTEVVPNERASWRSLEGGRLEMEGTLRVHPEDGGSVLDLDLCYNPPGGVLGDLLATLLGAGLRRCLREDLPRIQRALGAASGEVGSLAEGTAPEPAAPRAESTSKEARSRVEVEEPSTTELKTGGDPRLAPESGDRAQP